MARKILLADDSVTAQNMGRKILADAGYEVLTVNNGSAALKKVAESKPDLIVLDVYMPGYSGLEVCQRLKEVGETARIPILLTVGKLEPFKPEEAKRVRADGFIVKPFEASELLSVLTKLEDKIVPRAETSKPGRFARAIAAVEEGRYDKTMAVEEDSGWKNRIAFPSGKKKKSAEPEDVDDPAIYNPINKDLRTILDRKPESAQKNAHETAKVDLGALTTDGLPKDVTPEEIAALAAAAAQIQGIAGQEQRHDERERSDAVGAESQPAAEASNSDLQPEAKAEAQAESTLESREDLPKVGAAQSEEGKRDSAHVEATAQATTMEAPAASSADLSHSADSVAVSPVEAETFLAADAAASDGEKDRSNSYSYAAAAEPMTMAAAAGADSISSRWMAVPVALLPEEAAISLEHEMQKAHAAFAAAEMAQASEPKPEEDSIAWAPPAAVEAPVAAETHNQADLEAKGSAAAESISAVVRELEARAAALLAEEAASSVEAETSYLRPPEPVAVASAENIAAIPPLESTPVVSEPEPSAFPQPESASAQSGIAAAESAQPAEEVKAEDTASAPARLAQTADAEDQIDPAPNEVSAELPSAATVVEAAAQTEQESSRAEAAIPETQSQDIPAEAVASAISESAPSEASRENAAASASNSWHQIRDLADTSAHSSAQDESKDSAAMAVAAGAEHAPQDASEASDSGDPTEIANIVDSVLADLRPRIVAEISKKMGKKK